MSSRLILQHARIMGSTRLTDIVVEDGRIVRLMKAGEEGRGPGSSYLDLGGKLVLPGFVDIHMHLDKAMTWPKLSNVSGTLQEAIHKYAGAQFLMDVDDLVRRMKAVVRLAIQHGTTAIRTHLDYGTPNYCAKVVEAFHIVKAHFEGCVDLEAVLMCPLHIDKEAARAIRSALGQGIRIVGGAPHLAASPRENLEHIFELAVAANADIDVHIDESDDPRVNTLPYLSEKTVEARYLGRVTAGHCTSLSAMDEEQAHEVMAQVKEAQIGIVTLPACNLFLSGREDRGLIRRGLTRVRQLEEMGIPVAIGSDNIRDPFHPYGNADLLHAALLASYGAHLTTEAEMNMLIAMITSVPAGLARLEHYGLQAGGWADFVIVESADARSALAEQPVSRETWKRGRPICQVTETLEWDERLGAT